MMKALLPRMERLEKRGKLHCRRYKENIESLVDRWR
jgi:hypothetical protein